MFVYLEPADNMNKRTFRAFVTGTYEPRLPKRFIKNGQPPIYPDIDTFAEARVTPAMIVDMCYHKKEINIPSIDDLFTIIQIIELYMDSIKSLKTISPELRQYNEKCKEALEQLKTVHADWLSYLKQKDPGRFGLSGVFVSFYSKLKERYKP